MCELFILTIQVLVTFLELLCAGGLCTVVTESLLLKHQILVQ